MSDPFEAALDRLFLVKSSPGQLRQLQRYLVALTEPPEALDAVAPVTPAESEAALDWLLDRIGYERAA